MPTWIENLWEEFRANFWFVPTLMVAGAVALSLAALQVDRLAGADNWVAALGWTYTRGPEGSRAVLSTVAGSMATIAGVTFSITVVALQLASSQFGPRLLRNFVRDRGNQVAMGAFIATFTYSLLVLRTVNGTEDERFVPHLAVTVGLVLALVSLGVLIYFIHHTAATIQAEHVIAAVGRDLDEAVDRLFPEELGEDPPPSPLEAGLPPGFDRESRPVEATTSGYLQALDEQGLMRMAQEGDLVLGVGHRPGQFVTEGAVLVRVWPGEALDDARAAALRGAFYFGTWRTPTQDVEFVVDQLVEIAVRALSPGVNDPFTAMACVDRLGASLCRLARREIPSAHRCDAGGRLRVITVAATPPGIVDAAFHQIRQAARGNAAVAIRLLDTLAVIAAAARHEPIRRALRHHAELIARGGREGLPEAWDRAEVERRYHRVLGVLGPEGPGAEASGG